jgi:hypothetical protein
MTKEEYEVEISQHLNATTPRRRKEVLDDIEYNLALKSGDLEGAFGRMYTLVHGAAKYKSDIRRVRKKERRQDILDSYY